ncbi:MAG TPA: hypothetical protein PK079_21455 [Leptospiraceae bacterium]|nr:hypothetical protein [Leptospiraceae bacterium]HMW03654.1 hypothetical protein [Leptospiraceae bacterium]HMX31219.1 hypothetical protein [Leptospiraceae bacterium]HMY29425.1 hypothetical protein [Leptospiraceae bacterium]HMZ65835.1 hypothetical protein [Leptospiraceae bacterium]
MKLGIITNTLSTRNDELTTHDIAFAALQRGHSVYMMSVYDLYSDGKTVYGNVRVIHKKGIDTRVDLTRNLKNFSEEKFRLNDLDVLMLRHKHETGDKGETFHKTAREYAFHLQEAGVLVFNDPRYLPFVSSKLSTLSLDNSILPPHQLISGNFEDLYKYCKDVLKYEGVIKPLGGKGGEDIYFTEKRNLRNNLKSLLKQGPVLIQSYIPNNGDKRILLLDGEPIAWYLRVANDGEFLNNIHAGGKPVKCDLTDRDKKIIEVVKPKLKKYGILFAGIDILGNYLSEMNTENPGGTVRADKLGNFNSKEKIIDFLEKRIKK